MKRERFSEAINLFRTKYGLYPLSAGYPAVDLDQQQGIYLFAKTGEHLKAFHRKERLFIWLFKWVMPLTVVVLTAIVIGLIINPSTVLFFNFIVFGVISSLLLLILGTLFKKEKFFTAGKVIWLNLPPKPAHFID